MKHKPRCVLKIISSCLLHKNCQLSSFEQYSFQITPHNEVPYNTADKADAPPLAITTLTPHGEKGGEKPSANGCFLSVLPLKCC